MPNEEYPPGLGPMTDPTLQQAPGMFGAPAGQAGDVAAGYAMAGMGHSVEYGIRAAQLAQWTVGPMYAAHQESIGNFGRAGATRVGLGALEPFSAAGWGYRTAASGVGSVSPAFGVNYTTAHTARRLGGASTSGFKGGTFAMRMMARGASGLGGVATGGLSLLATEGAIQTAQAGYQGYQAQMTSQNLMGQVAPQIQTSHAQRRAFGAQMIGQYGTGEGLSEMQGAIQEMGDAGMFRGTRDIAEFKKVLGRNMKLVKEIASVTSSTIKEATQLTQGLRSMGVQDASISGFASLLGGAGTSSRLGTGAMIDAGAQGAATFGQLGYTRQQGAFLGVDTLSAMSQAAQSGSFSQEQLYRMGGVGGAARSVQGGMWSLSNEESPLNRLMAYAVTTKKKKIDGTTVVSADIDQAKLEQIRSGQVTESVLDRVNQTNLAAAQNFLSSTAGAGLRDELIAEVPGAVTKGMRGGTPEERLQYGLQMFGLDAEGVAANQAYVLNVGAARSASARSAAIAAQKSRRDSRDQVGWFGRNVTPWLDPISEGFAGTVRGIGESYEKSSFIRSAGGYRTDPTKGRITQEDIQAAGEYEGGVLGSRGWDRAVSNTRVGALEGSEELLQDIKATSPMLFERGRGMTQYGGLDALMRERGYKYATKPAMVGGASVRDVGVYEHIQTGARRTAKGELGEHYALPDYEGWNETVWVTQRDIDAARAASNVQYEFTSGQLVQMKYALSGDLSSQQQAINWESQEGRLGYGDKTPGGLLTGTNVPTTGDSGQRTRTMLETALRTNVISMSDIHRLKSMDKRATQTFLDVTRSQVTQLGYQAGVDPGTAENLWGNHDVPTGTQLRAGQIDQAIQRTYDKAPGSVKRAIDKGGGMPTDTAGRQAFISAMEGLVKGTGRDELWQKYAAGREGEAVGHLLGAGDAGSPESLKDYRTFLGGSGTTLPAGPLERLLAYDKVTGSPALTLADAAAAAVGHPRQRRDLRAVGWGGSADELESWGEAQSKVDPVARSRATGSLLRSILNDRTDDTNQAIWLKEKGLEGLASTLTAVTRLGVGDPNLAASLGMDDPTGDRYTGPAGQKLAIKELEDKRKLDLPAEYGRRTKGQEGGGEGSGAVLGSVLSDIVTDLAIVTDMLREMKGAAQPKGKPVDPPTAAPGGWVDFLNTTFGDGPVLGG